MCTRMPINSVNRVELCETCLERRISVDNLLAGFRNGRSDPSHVFEQGVLGERLGNELRICERVNCSYPTFDMGREAGRIAILRVDYEGFTEIIFNYISVYYNPECI